MAEESLFRGAINTLNEIGLYDVILPFLLVFTLVYAILEKTKILGTEEINGKEVSRKNLNSVVAFVIALFVVASSWIVNKINQIAASVVLVIILIFLYILTVGTFFQPTKDEKEFKIPKGIQYTFMVVAGVAIVIIFVQSMFDFSNIDLNISGFFANIFTPTVISTIVLLAIIILALVFIVREPKSKK